MGATLPKQGTEWSKLKTEMETRGSHDVKWREGKTAVYVFNAGPDVAEVQKEASCSTRCPVSAASRPLLSSSSFVWICIQYPLKSRTAGLL